MSVPKKKKSHSKARKERNHQALTPIGLGKCPRCGNARRPHTVCANCGTYRDKVVINVEADAE